jgi:hypothetical protein
VAAAELTKEAHLANLPSMLFLPLALEFLLDIFASWTVAYHLILVTHRPAYYTVPVWLILMVALLEFSLRGRGFSLRTLGSFGPRNRSLKGEGELLGPAREPGVRLGIARWPATCLLLMGLAAGAVTLTVFRPDYDDMTLFHRILVQDWRQPFVTGDTVSNYPGLPPQSILHVTTSYEPLVGLVAKVVHISPLRVYHNAPGFLAAIIMVAIYFLLYRVLGLGEWTSTAAVGLVLLFLMIDGNSHGSFGNMALDRLWQGKCIVWSVLVPACLLGTYQFLNRPTFRRFLRLVLLGICGLGMSEVGVYTQPILVLALGLGWLATSRRPLGRLRSTFILWSSMFYPVAAGLALALGILHKPGAHEVWNSFPAVWYENLAIGMGSDGFGYTVARDLVAVVLLPLVALKGRQRLFVLSLSLVLLVLITNPVAAPVWMKLLYRASYWRLAFLFPLPFCVGLVAPALLRLRAADLRLRIGAGLAVILFLVMTVASFREPAKLPIGEGFKRPGTLQLERYEVRFSRAAGPMLHGTNILAPESIVCALAMLMPELRFESSRPVNDPMKFGEVGLSSEGQKRVQAQRFTNCEVAPKTWNAFRAALDDGVDTVVLKQCPELDLTVLLTRLPGWSVAYQDQDYVLLLKQ